MTPPTTNIAIVNSTGSSDAWAYITGLEIDNNNRPCFIQADGRTVYRPSSPPRTQGALAADVAIPLGAAGSRTTMTIPRIAGGRIWFAVGARLTFLLNPGPAIVEPSPLNRADPNYGLRWGFCEFTYNDFQLFVNISYVDFVALPIALQLRNTAGRVQTVRGIPRDGLDTICERLTQQSTQDGGDAGWARLVVKGADGRNLRALSPNSGRVMDAGIFSGLYAAYVEQVWAKYAVEDLTINTQAQWGEVKGRVRDGLLTFDGVGTFAKPSAGDIFSCSTGPFGGYPAEHADEMGAIGARLAAAFNRSTLLANPLQPDGERVASYYARDPTNHFARIVHEVNLDRRGYAFPYDDVNPSNLSEPDQAGTVFDESPELLTVTLGGPVAGGDSNENREIAPAPAPVPVPGEQKSRADDRKNGEEGDRGDENKKKGGKESTGCLAGVSATIKKWAKSLKTRSSK